MAQDFETKIFPGGIRNRINRITLRTTGDAVGHYNGPHTGQTGVDARAVISRTVNEPPVSRKKNPATKEEDV